MKVHGYNLAFCGQRDELDSVAALKTIQAKTIWSPSLNGERNGPSLRDAKHLVAEL